MCIACIPISAIVLFAIPSPRHHFLCQFNCQTFVDRNFHFQEVPLTRERTHVHDVDVHVVVR